ncbi:MCP four helix bundle domain-containing protein [Rufibacter glacialis]|uniref:MCP four helix bundle domain-containing protein n=1 Tax=Rufibacter glacialis TaxID=1259555 RepID=A0ABV4RMJ4_9BACT|nr:MCP four helix bundle domain-containing protein [Rufibacter glacialis]
MKHKTKAALLLALVLVLVLAKNFMDSKNVSKLGTSFASVYEDRLLVESYIYQLSDHLYQKKMMVDKNFYAAEDSGLPTRLKEKNAAISELLVAYEKTQLTETEATYFSSLKQNLQELSTLEQKYLLQPGTEQEQRALAKHRMDGQYAQATNHLHQLSGIQVAEGKRLNEQTKRIIAGSSILTQFELVLIIAIGVMIQMLVFASKSKLSKFPQNPILN